MPANKSTGNDKTPVRVIKDSIAAISSLIDASFAYGIFP